MKKLVLSIMAFGSLISSQAQETVTLSMGAGYADEVYFNLEDQATNTFDAASWDIAFLRHDPMDMSIRVNDGVGIQVFEASDDPADFNTIDVANEANWTPLYNDDTDWDNGAFMQGSATFGWGEYNPANHHVEGTIVFVLKYADGTYVKFINEDYFGAYTFKYASWDGTNWIGETTRTVANTTNPENRYNYFSLRNNIEVVAEPALDAWDFVFTKYNTFLDPPGQNYIVTGVLHSPEVTVAENDETTGAGDPNTLTYLEEINTIGYDWKSFTGSGYDVNSDMAYYVKIDANTVYRVIFTEFEGSSSGNITFTIEDVSDQLGVESVSDNVSFGMFPNPTANGQVTVVFENVTSSSIDNSVEIYTMNGAKVLKTEVTNNGGFYQKNLNVSSLQSGVYVVKFTAGNSSVSKKLIIQ